MLGEEYDAFLDSFSQEKYQALRLNALKRNQKGESAAQVFSPIENRDSIGMMSPKAPFHLTSVSWAQDGYYYEASDTPGKHPYHEAGLYYIQEPSAMAPVGFLGVKPGEKILDLCAAPGGKSTQIAALLEEKGLLISNEIHPARAKILSENMERMGVRNACVTNETPAHLQERFVEYFDRILVDAPCSGEGMFRKNDAACEEWSLENVELCGARQDEILDCAAAMLRPGGRMVYSTCTFAPTENEGSISRFLARHSDFSLVTVDKGLLGKGCDGVPGYLPEKEAAEGIENTIRLWPHHIKGEGHYIAVLQKDGCERVPVCGWEEGLKFDKLQKQKDMADFISFWKDNLLISLENRDDLQFLRFGDNLYLAPRNLPSLKGMKVLRPGLHLGTMKKNRFEPSHALALALSPTEAAHVWNLSSTEDTVRAYLNGQTFPAEGEKGWYLVCVDGFSLGWGKLAGGIMKNHYPKGLRK